MARSFTHKEKDMKKCLSLVALFTLSFAVSTVEVLAESTLERLKA